ncbi:hypothetical protein GBA52_010797 [Prunus armeniaca]|nr:hypothetical protein GBA52_010797 [Prunus armeniaca]
MDLIPIFSSKPRSWSNHARFHRRLVTVIALLDLTASSHFSSKSSHCRHSSLRLWGAGLVVVYLKLWALVLLK